jgi:hypothetical protein
MRGAVITAAHVMVSIRTMVAIAVINAATDMEVLHSLYFSVWPQ